jgi:CubicO group peptidase (beta-lactamase class C family)
VPRGTRQDIDSDVAPDEWIARLAKLPLIDQPAGGMHYGCSTDLPEKRNRRAAAYGFDEQARLTKRLTWGEAFVEERPQDMAYESGGAGLWSTIDDYLKFARLFLGDGEVDGVRLLRPETLAMMMTNQLTETQRANFVLLGQKPFAAGRGFGLGFRWFWKPTPPIGCAGVARGRSAGRVHLEGGGRQILTRVLCSSSWRTTWSIWLRWLKVLVWACGTQSTGFRWRPWNGS